MWVRQGRIYTPRGEPAWRTSHAQLPTVDPVDGDRWRIHFAVRDRQGRSRPTFVETEAGRPERLLREHDEPVLELGPPGAFDDSGVMPSWVTHVGGHRYFFYTGWSQGVTVPYQTEIGLAVSDDGGHTYTKVSDGPVLGRSATDPYVTGSPCVLLDEGRFRCWYHSGTEWVRIDGKWEPRYRIVHAESDDGVSWRRDGIVAIDYAGDEAGLGRPSVVRDGDHYRMWFSRRGGRGYRSDPRSSYRIGYAESGDGLAWERRDAEAGIDVAEEGWDSEMICYPHVVDHRGERLMLYNGNGFGRTGFGYARQRGPDQAGATAGVVP